MRWEDIWPHSLQSLLGIKPYKTVKNLQSFRGTSWLLLWDLSTRKVVSAVLFTCSSLIPSVLYRLADENCPVSSTVPVFPF